MLIVQHSGEQRLNLISGLINMRTTTYHRLPFLLLMAFSLALSANTIKQRPSDEKVVLLTDRSLYIKGEQILFTACLFDETQTVTKEPSKVLYCELVSPDGNKVTGNKFLLDQGRTQGYLSIPTDVVTGYYYIRAYTRYMRNFGPSCFDYTLLKIINPDNPTLLSGTNGDTVIRTMANAGTFDGISLKTDKSKYGYRDTVKLTLEGIQAASFSNTVFCVSIVPEKSFSENKPLIPCNQQFKPDKQYYRENKGLSVTGNLTESKTGKPSVSTRINLVIIGKGKDFMAVNTDDKGRFFFALPDYTGFRDILLSTDSKNKDSLRLQVDNDFCPIHERLPSPVFRLSEDERACALQMAGNAKLSLLFPGDTMPAPLYNKEIDNAFYGKPDEVLILDNYVQLSSLEEYFNELALYAKVRKSHGKPYFKVLGEQPNLNMYEPLILVDWVAIDDPARILAISPQNVARIEIVNKIYVKGDQSYGGIISIISKQGDFAGIDLPSSSIFINYRFLSEPDPRQSINFNLPHHPDSRNTLFWTTGRGINSGKPTEWKFTTSDSPGKYIVVFRGINQNGEESIKTAYFEVSP